jgi:hypothetical protein
MWAGIMAIADQYAGRGLGFVNPAIHEIAKGPRYQSAFHDVTRDTTTVRPLATHLLGGYSAGPGWDLATVWGTPDASVLMPLLTGDVKTGKVHHHDAESLLTTFESQQGPLLAAVDGFRHTHSRCLQLTTALLPRPHRTTPADQ